MSKIRKYNEFINNDDILIHQLIEKVENTNSSDPISIADSDLYKQIISIGDNVIPYLIERNQYIWNIALKKITGVEPDIKLQKSSEIIEFWKNWGLENGYR